jgi:hypothetical protein
MTANKETGMFNNCGVGEWRTNKMGNLHEEREGESAGKEGKRKYQGGK